MATKLILQRDVENLGIAGEVVEVKDGYARNYLMPRGLAVLWTKGAQRHLDAEQEKRRKHEITNLEDAIAVREKIMEEPVVVIEAKASETGRLFGAVTGRVIADAMQKQYATPFDQRAITFDGPIKKAGNYEASIRILDDVRAPFEVHVVADET